MDNETPTVNLNEAKETESTTEIAITQEILDQLSADTKSRAIEDTGEAQFFLLGKNGVADQIVEVGLSYSEGVVYSPEDVARKLAPLTDTGTQIVADYHNHPQRTLDVFKAANLPEEYASGPSGSDIGLDTQLKIQHLLSQQPYPRIIGVYLPQRDQVIMSAVKIVREANTEDNSTAEFEDPLHIEDTPDELGIKLLPSLYSNPRILHQRGVIQPVVMNSVNRNGKRNTIPNPIFDQRKDERQ